MDRKAFGECTKLEKICCRAIDAPQIETGTGISTFSQSIYASCTLYVPEGSYFNYFFSNWSAFNIQEITDQTGVQSPKYTEEEDDVTYYSIDGKLLPSLKEGFGIVRKKNGKSYKIWKK